VSPPEPELIAGEYWYTIYFGPGKKGRHPEGDLEPFELATGVADILRAERFASREAFTKLLCHLRLSTSLRSQIYAMAASRTTFYAYQFKPLLKFLESRHHRLLIADEVGLGKTIETGLIFTELRQRRPLKRVLIVPPSHLMIKWREEMRNRFDLQFDILDTNGAFDFLRRFEEEGDETTLRGILSLQTLRGRRLQERWEAVEPALDLVVFDEAGRLRNPETRSHGAASLVGENADGVLLLTATPVQTGDDNLFHLLRLLEPDEFSSFDVFCDRLAANRHVLDTLRLLAQPDVDLTTCAAVLRRVEATPIAQRFVQNPLYNDVLHRLQ
jgi:SNF2 family DNA or RNA helicase